MIDKRIHDVGLIFQLCRAAGISSGRITNRDRNGGKSVGMRPNHAKRKIMAGVPVLATGFGIHSLPDGLTLEYLAQKGALDVAWIEFEHGAASWRDLSEKIGRAHV